MLWRNRAPEHHAGATESRRAIDLALAARQGAIGLNHEAADIMRQCLRQMDEHSNKCPFYQQIVTARHGLKWHASTRCASLVGRSTHSLPIVLWPEDFASRSS